MADTHILTALQDKYRRTKGQLSALDAQAAQLRIDLDHIEHVIRLFQQDWRADNTTIVPRKPSRWQKRGQGIQTALAVLREASEPMTVREIVLAVYNRLGQPLPTKDELRRQVSTIGARITLSEGKSVVRVEGKPIRWSISC
ncbi:MAG: hypothetical protein ABI668_05620 [Sphingorhabdus sp.]